jgi:hypothetical protein
MKYFIDTEFIEGFHKPLFGKRRHFIDLISIGIKCEDGREYYAICNEFDPEDASEWVQENVLYSIMVENGYPKSLSNLHGYMSYDRQAVRDVQARRGKTIDQIACEILKFIYDPSESLLDSWLGFLDDYYKALHKMNNERNPVFYGYYSDYDWVLFCSLFGVMIEKPAGFPMFCIDLKQMMEERGFDKQWKDKNCPDPIGEHNAIVDAEWNFQLFKAILSHQEQVESKPWPVWPPTPRL